MALRKRDLSDDISDIHNGSPSSGSPNNSKRARLDTQASDDDYFDPEETALDIEMTQRVREQAEKTSENPPAEGGVVTKVLCENFMCHEYLEVPFGPFMNFIIGHNGSGKSAVLTALTLCLGGKATSTNRGNSLKSFIKEGQDTGRVTVWLTNGGEDGYRQDAYGRVIIIARTFSRDGGSSYKLKSSNGKTVSSKKEELDNITDFYGLQVDNPMTILTQDNARAFLSNSSNAEKYKFFNRGVQLEQLDQDYSLVKTAIRNTDAMLDSKKEALEELDKKQQEAQQKVQQFQSHDGLRAKHRELQHQMAWIQVRDAEFAVQKQEEVIRVAKQKISKVEQKRDDAGVDYESADHERTAAKEKTAVERANKEPFEEEKAQHKEEFERNKKELLEITHEQRNVKGTIDSSRRKIRDFTEKIKAEERRLEALNGGSSVHLSESINAAKTKIDNLAAERKSVEERLKSDLARLEEAKKSLENAQGQFASKGRDLEQSRKLLRQLTQDGGQNRSNAYLGYPARMGDFVREIEREDGFQQKPIGPLGKYITLRKSKWMSIVERFFGNSLSGFVVANHTDAQILRRLSEKTRCYVPVFVSSGNHFNIEEPDPKFDTILRVLHIESEAVRRQLIILHLAEQAILIEDLEEANHVMSTRTPRDNIHTCFALNRSKPGLGHKVGGAIGVMSVTPVPRFNGLGRMKTEDVDQKEGAQNEIRRHEMELPGLESAVQSAKQKIHDFEATISRSQGRMRELSIEIQRQEDEIERLKTQIEEMSVDGELNLLQQRLNTAEEDQVQYTRQYEELETNRLRLDKEQQRLSSLMRSLDQDLQMCEQRITAAEEEEKVIAQRREQSLANKNYWSSKLAGFAEILALQEAQKQELENTVTAYTEMARGVCERVEVPPDETAKNLDRRLTRISDEIKTAEQALGSSREESIAALLKATTEYNAAKEQCDELDDLLAESTNVLIERQTRWGLFQAFISARARAQFSFLMSERAFTGRLRLEHNQRPPELIIQVQPGGEATGNRGPKTLSGGEKSFATICLLLSLWEAMGSPLRCLDEFDVFMDSVNRSISVEMMIKAAERSAGKQFILITPQNMSQAGTTRCQITRIADPIRSGGKQTRLVLTSA